MKKLLPIIAMLALVGCAQWQDMTPKQRWAIVATSVVIGAAAANQDDGAAVSATADDPWKPWAPLPQCAPAKCQ